MTLRATLMLAVAATVMALLGCEPRLLGGGSQSHGADVMEIHDLAVVVEELAAPTDVVLADDGSIFVLDAHGAGVLVIDSKGQLRHSIVVPGQPVGMALGPEGLVLPLSDRSALLTVDPESGRVGERPGPPLAAGDRLTDVLVRGDELIVVSNLAGLWRGSFAGDDWEVVPVGGLPFMGFMIAGSDDEVVLGDVQDDLVLRLDPELAERTDLGQWGVWEGTFLHPTGLAIDSRGRIFVADGFMGVVQVFNRDGEFLGALGRDGELLRMKHPMGLSLVDDRLLVVDLGAGRVLSMRVDDRTRPATPQDMYSRKIPRQSYLEGTETPHTMLTPVCETCHDGSIQSSPHVWGTLAQHPVNVVPDKPIPEPFTLDEQGQLYCGTCHIPHRMGESLDASDADMEVFLKEPRARSQLCLACHTNVVAEVRKVSGPIPPEEAGHIVGEVPRDVPRTGTGAIDTEVSRVECLDCHAPHGAVGESLLSREAATSSGCTECHVGVSPARGMITHPVDRPVQDPAAIQALRLRDVFLGPGDTVSCLTCHDVHSSSTRDWLTSKMSAEERCVVCHQPQTGVAGGGHDLRLGGGEHVATACLACHAIHAASGPCLGKTGGDMRDPTGCQSCHGRGGQARAEISAGAGHPLFERNESGGRLPSVGLEGSLEPGAAGNTGCLTCHDPHVGNARRNRAMLRLPGGDGATCLACHPDKAPVVGSDHDLRDGASGTLAEDLEAGGMCLACHGMHQSDDWNGWDGPLGGPASESKAVRACLGCHQAGNARGAAVVQAWDHPGDLLLTTAKVPWRNTGELPLYDDRGRPTDDTQIGQITCLTCHDAHVWSPKRGGTSGRGEGDTQTSFLRDGWEGFCSGCHGEEALAVYRYFHDLSYREELRQRQQRREWPIYQEQQP